MEITSINFFKQLPLVQKSIESADFIAFDTEFSGKRKNFLFGIFTKIV